MQRILLRRMGNRLSDVRCQGKMVQKKKKKKDRRLASAAFAAGTAVLIKVWGQERSQLSAGV